MPARKATSPKPEKNKSLESWIWDAACSLRGAKDAPKYKGFEKISEKRLGLEDVEADIIGKSYEYLIRKFAEGEFYTPPEVGTIMSKVLQPEPGMEIYDPTCGSGGLLIKCEIAMEEAAKDKKRTIDPLKLYGQDQWAWGAHLRRAQRARRVRQRRKLPNQYVADTWAMACMNMIIHDMEGTIEIGDTFKNPKFREAEGALPGKFRHLHTDIYGTGNSWSTCGTGGSSLTTKRSASGT